MKQRKQWDKWSQ